METSGTTSGISRSLGAATPSLAGQWQVGQLLQATVTESHTGKVLLAIGNRQISAETSLAFEKGQQLTLQVRSLGEQPVLKITTPQGESPINSAIRLLLPKQGPIPPLLATMGRLTRSHDPSVPSLINELVRSVVKQMPDTQTAATPQGLKKAIGESGVFLERQLLQQHNSTHRPLFIDLDFKANLLRLVQLVRHWPGSSGQTTANAPQSAAGTSATGAQAAPPGTTAERGAAAQTTASTDQIQRTVQASVNGKAATATPAPASTTSLQATAGSATGTGPATPPSLPAGALAPPLRGSMPVPQSALQNNLELLNRAVDFRTDLLHQAEAALARIQLHQLAALPREGERGLLEWLLEVPIRRGEDIDLWSMRVFAEQQQQQPETRQQVPNWSVQLAFDLPGLGPMQAQVQLAGEQVSTRFWAEQQATLPLLREHMHELRQALSEAGLDVGQLECQPGPRPAVKPTGSQTLIREKA
ncbi:MAG: flagellar hook-length control protein FliK [Thiogranum sp.]